MAINARDPVPKELRLNFIQARAPREPVDSMRCLRKNTESCEKGFVNLKYFVPLHLHTVVVAQQVRAVDCGSTGRGFEPHLPPSQNEGAVIAAPFLLQVPLKGGFVFFESRFQVSVGSKVVQNTFKLAWRLISGDYREFLSLFVQKYIGRVRHPALQ